MQGIAHGSWLVACVLLAAAGGGQATGAGSCTSPAIMGNPQPGMVSVSAPHAEYVHLAYQPATYLVTASGGAVSFIVNHIVIGDGGGCYFTCAQSVAPQASASCTVPPGFYDLQVDFAGGKSGSAAFTILALCQPGPVPDPC
jgi:hypothetical protein